MRSTGRRLTAGLVVAPLVFAAVAAVTSTATAAQPQPHSQAQAGSQPRIYTLPTGDHVRVAGTKAEFLPLAGHSAAAVTTWVDGRPTVVPVSEIGHLSSLSAFELGDPQPAVAQPHYAMSPLDIKATDHSGKPAQAAEVVVINTDNPAKAKWDGIMSAGDSRIQVPTGHYSVGVAVFETDAKGNPTETDLLTATDVTVPAAGTTVSVDARTAQQVSFTTPQPTVNSATVVDWTRGLAGKTVSLDIGAMAGTDFYVGAAAKPSYGTLQYSASSRRVAADGSYSYALLEPETNSVPANETFTIPASSLAEIDSTYLTDQPSQDALTWDEFDRVTSAPGTLPELPYTEVHEPATDRRYVSTGPSYTYDALLQQTATSIVGEFERRLTLKGGQHLSLAWRGGLMPPAPSTVDGSCFLCRSGDTLHGIGAEDTDFAGDQSQWSDGPTTITQDGKQIYGGSTMGYQFDQPLPAAKHRYVYSINTTHDGSASNLSTHSQIAWGFDSATANGPVAILYASAGLTTDGHASVATGAASLAVTFQHQAGAADPDVTTATADVSYDDGTTWQPVTVKLTDGHHAAGTFTVPAGTKPGYLALRLHGVDKAGSTLDETVNHAALVNAPNGIASPASGSTADQHAVCATAAVGHARCLAVTTPAKWQPSATKKLPDGLARADLLSAYNLPATGGTGATVAIVDAHDDPTAESDLATYRKTYGLPACTSATGCFTKLNEHGKTSPLPPYDPNDDWTDEISLDLDMVSAVCPSCHIVLVESDNSDTDSLATAEVAATGSGAVAVSNSFGGDESSDTAKTVADFQHTGVAITASSGDNGFRQASWPASLASVISVGGTTLRKSSGGRGWTETAWQGAGSGCSAYTAKPAWQQDPHCPGRTVSDLSAVADPATGVAVYVSGQWVTAGGTSVSSPIIASMIALAGNASALGSAKYIYAHAKDLYDITSGSNANWDCGGDYLCTAGKGYDGPTGLGTPHGLGAL